MSSLVKQMILKLVPLWLKDRVWGRRFRVEQGRVGAVDVGGYWTGHTVRVSEEHLRDRASSLAHFESRCSRYPGYLELMPVSGLDGLRILDFGCGPGHDLAGMLEHSAPGLLVGADVSPTALAIADRRVRLHPGGDRLQLLRSGSAGELEDEGSAPFDYIHCSGVLHHIVDPGKVLGAFKRLLAPEGRVRIMVYNRDSIWRNFYVPYILQHRRRAIDLSVPLDDAFRMSTDGPNCPVSRSYDSAALHELAAAAGFRCEVVGASLSQHELRMWRDYKRAAMRDRRTPSSVRSFLEGLSLDADGELRDRSGNRPGINLVAQLTHA